MKFEQILIQGSLIKRYKRFLADIQLDNGKIVTAHCANPGSMMGLVAPGSPVWLSRATNPKAKLDYKWELVAVEGCLVGINTAHPNRLAEEAVLAGKIPELQAYQSLRREVKYSQNSRIDLLLSDSTAGQADCYVEVKNVTLSRQPGVGEFPDSVTTRGTKHLHALMQMVAEGHRAVMLYLVQRDDCQVFQVADDIDPAYGAALRAALEFGVEAVCYGCNLSSKEIIIGSKIPISLNG